jgi:transposase
MDERPRFVARLLDGEKMAALCREFGISRKTGYKIYHRYKDSGLEGLTAPRRPLPPRTAVSMRLLPAWWQKRLLDR